MTRARGKAKDAKHAAEPAAEIVHPRIEELEESQLELLARALMAMQGSRAIVDHQEYQLKPHLGTTLAELRPATLEGPGLQVQLSEVIPDVAQELRAVEIAQPGMLRRCAAHLPEVEAHGGRIAMALRDGLEGEGSASFFMADDRPMLLRGVLACRFGDQRWLAAEGITLQVDPSGCQLATGEGAEQLQQVRALMGRAEQLLMQAEAEIQGSLEHWQRRLEAQGGRITREDLLN